MTIRILASAVAVVWIVAIATFSCSATAMAQTVVLSDPAELYVAPQARHGLGVRIGPDAFGGNTVGAPKPRATSPNWSGYYVSGNTYTAVTGTWTVPTVLYASYAQSAALPGQHSSTWIGIGGWDTDGTLIQLGTEQNVDSSSATPIYFAWYETITPGTAGKQVQLTKAQLPVNPGDTITATLQCTTPGCPVGGFQQWTLSIHNVTQNITWTESNIAYSSSLATAEWIMEATSAIINPTDTVSVIRPLPYYTPTTFSALTANNVSPNLSLSGTAVIMNDPNGGASTPSYPIADNSFTVNYLAPPCNWVKTVGECFTAFSTNLTPNSRPSSIAAGSDGALWFTETDSSKIGRIDITGIISEFPLAANSNPQGITAGPDGALWFTEFNSGNIGRITATPQNPQITYFRLPVNNQPVGITAGPDGALWFAIINGAIGRLDPTTATPENPQVKVFPLTASPDVFGNLIVGWPQQITTGSDGALWFTELNVNRIGRLPTTATPNNPQIIEFHVPTTHAIGTYGITAGPDGALWFTVLTDNRIGRIPTPQDAKFLAELERTFLTEVDRSLLATLDSSDSLDGQMLREGFLTEELAMKGANSRLGLRREIFHSIAVKAADSLIEAGKLDQAEQAARKLLERFPDRYDGWVCLGNISQARGDRRHAAGCFRKVIHFIRTYPEHYSPESEDIYREVVDELDPRPAT